MNDYVFIHHGEQYGVDGADDFFWRQDLSLFGQYSLAENPEYSVDDMLLQYSDDKNMSVLVSVCTDISIYENAIDSCHLNRSRESKALRPRQHKQ